MIEFRGALRAPVPTHRGRWDRGVKHRGENTQRCCGPTRATDDEELRALWQRTAEAALKDPAGWHGAAVSVPAQFLVLVT